MGPVKRLSDGLVRPPMRVHPLLVGLRAIVPLLAVFVLVPLAGAQTTSGPQTLFKTNLPITGLTEDAGHVAWIAQPHSGCARLHIRTLWTGATVTTPKCAGGYGEMAMANGRVLWKAEGGYGNTEAL